MSSPLRSCWTAYVTCKFPSIALIHEIGCCRSPAGVYSTPPLLARSYLVMPFMGTDLGKLMKLERLSEDRVQFLVYQMLRGLKVSQHVHVHVTHLLNQQKVRVVRLFP